MNNRAIAQPGARCRIVNFTTLEAAAGHPELRLEATGGRVEEAVDLLRRHADLPHLYLVDAGREGEVGQILSRLRAIRSSCSPYAIFVASGDYGHLTSPECPVIVLGDSGAEALSNALQTFADSRFHFDKGRLACATPSPPPTSVEVLIIGGGITGLYAARRLAAENISCCVVEQREIIGGIWSDYANTTSQVNTSEGAYRLLEKSTRSNRDHSTTREMLEDLEQTAAGLAGRIFTSTRATRFDRVGDGYRTRLERNGERFTVASRGIILAINDRVGRPREPSWPDQQRFTGTLCSGNSDLALGVDWRNRKVAIIGMGAFSIENARTALEQGASQVTVVCRRHGTVCPKIIDYLNFATPYDENFRHDKKSNIRNMLLWKKLYELSGATQPECWMGKIKHEGHTISVSDIWFIGHFLKRLSTVRGAVAALYEQGIVLEDGRRVEADIIVNCIGFHRMSPVVRELCDYTRMYNNNYIDRDLMYLADAYIDDDVFNSFFGSSVLEMTKFYLDVYIDMFRRQGFEEMLGVDGIEPIPIEDRRWSHYIAGAEALIAAYPRFREAAWKQIEERTGNFLEAHDLEVYLAQNRREWYDTHRLLSGRALNEDQCLPYLFDKLLEKRHVGGGPQ